MKIGPMRQNRNARSNEIDPTIEQSRL